MVKVLISTIVAAAILFVWGFLAWGVLPLHETSGGKLHDEAAMASTLREQAGTSGVYWLPAPPEGGGEEAVKAWTEAHEAGPLAMIIVSLEGRNPMDPMLFAYGFGINLATGLLLSLLVVWTRRSLGGFLGRTAFVVGIGMIIGLESDLKYWNWLYFPTDWSVMNVVDHLIGFGLAGIAIAAILKPAPKVVEVTQ